MSTFRIFSDNHILTNISSQMNKLLKSDNNFLTNSDRIMQSFSISSKSAGNKIEPYPSVENKFDTRTFTVGQKTYYPWLFSKTLKHDNNGMTTKEDLDRLINVSIENGINDSIEVVAQSQDPSKVRTLEGIATGNSFIIHGSDTKLYDVSTDFLPVDSITHVGEMIEVYEKGLLRDVPFISIANNTTPDVSRALQSINNYNTASGYLGPVSNSGQVTGKELFRGIGKDETIGPYISQFLILPFSYNGIKIEQKYPVENDVVETTDYTNYLNIQRGIVSGSPNLSGIYQYAYSGRVLGSIVHNDPMYWAYYNAALIGIQNGLSLQYSGSNVTSAWTDKGAPDGLASIAEVALGALRTAWHSKYNIGLKLRPEVMAFRIDQIINGVLNGREEFNTIKNHLIHGQNTLTEVKNQNSNHLLRLMYPEGSPTHPSFPAGHAVVAGACVTVLKAFFKTHDPSLNSLYWPKNAEHSTNGSTRELYNGNDKNRITITGELNKLASNISIGRNIAGVHYRADGDSGIKLGEKFAIKFLQTKLSEYISTYNGMIDNFTLEKMNGELIKITINNIIVLKSR